MNHIEPILDSFQRAYHIEPILDYFKRAWIHWKVDALGFQSMVFSCWDDEVALCF